MTGAEEGDSAKRVERAVRSCWPAIRTEDWGAWNIQKLASCVQEDMHKDDTRLRTGIHEAGHATVAAIMNRPIAFVTIERAGNTLGRVVFAERTTINMGEHRHVEREAALHLAGFAAELIYDRHTVPSGCADEVMLAYGLAMAIGHGDGGFYRLVWRTTRMLLAVWPCVLAVAGELHRRGTLDGLAVRRLVQRELGLRRTWSQARKIPGENWRNRLPLAPAEV